MLGWRLCRLKHSKEGCGKVECIVTKFFGYRRDFLKGDHNLCDKRAFFLPTATKRRIWFLVSFLLWVFCCKRLFFHSRKKATKEWINILSRFLWSQTTMKKFWILLSSAKTTRFCEMQQQKLHQPIFYRYVKFVPSEQQVCWEEKSFFSKTPGWSGKKTSFLLLQRYDYI